MGGEGRKEGGSGGGKGGRQAQKLGTSLNRVVETESKSLYYSILVM